MRKRILFGLLTAILLLALIACGQPAATETESDPTATPTQEATPEPTPTPVPEHDYGRDREAIGEYVYLDADGERFHEVECPEIYGELSPTLFSKAKDTGLTACAQCESMGDTQTPAFLYNPEFDRTMQVKKKINIRDKNGDYDLIYVTTGDDSFDINSLYVNDSDRNWYKEFGIDPSIIKVYLQQGKSAYHNTLCEDVVNVEKKYYLFLTDVLGDRSMKACTKCQPPTAAWITLPVNTPDEAHFYLANEKYIKKVLDENYATPPEMNIDLERARNGYYD